MRSGRGEAPGRDGSAAHRAAAHAAGVSQPRPVEPARSRRARRSGARRVRDHTHQRGRAGAAQRAHDPVLRDQGSGEPPRRAGHGGDLFLPSLPPAPVDQAAADGGDDAGDDHQGDARSDGRRAGAARGSSPGRLLARARPAGPQEPDAQRVQADRRSTQAAPRSDPQPGERGQGSDGLRAIHPRSGDPGPEPGGEGQRDRPRRHQADQPGGERSVIRAPAPHGGGGAIPPAQGDGQHRPAAGRAHVDGKQGGVRAAALQRHGHTVQHQTAAIPDQPGRGTRQGAARRSVGARRAGRQGRAAGRSLDEAESVSDDTSLTLFQQQEANRRHTVLLVIGFVAFFAWLGFGGDYIYYLSTRDAPSTAYHHVFPWFGIALTVIALLTAWYAYATGPEKVLWSTGARAVVDPTDPQEQQLVNVVEEMAIAAGVPRPRIWIVDDPDPNAFATGTDPLHAHIAVARGLLQLCNREEIQAVVGHELGHVKNLDVRLMTLLAALVGAVALMHDGVSRVLRGGFYLGGGGGGGGGVA